METIIMVLYRDYEVCRSLGFRVYLEGHGDLVSRLIMGIIGVIIWLIGFINLFTLSP